LKATGSQILAFQDGSEFCDLYPGPQYMA